MISVVGQASAVGASVALPAHQAGDIILIFARAASNTAPTIPAAGGTVPTWTQQQGGAGANTLSLVSAAAVATVSNHTSGTWTGASHVCALVLRTDTYASGGSLRAATSSTGNGSASTSLVYPALTLGRTDGTSMGVRVGADTVASTPVGTAPTNWTAQTVQPAGAGALMSVHTRASLAANPTADSVTGLTSGAYRAHTIEVQEVPSFPIGGIVDNFNRANKTPISSGDANWNTVRSDGWSIVSNQAQQLMDGSWDQMRWEAYTAADMEIYCTLVAIPAVASKTFQLWLRRDPGGADTGYYINLISTAAGTITSFEIWRRITGVDTQLTPTVSGITFSAGDGVGLSVKGSTLYVWRKPSGGSWGIIASRVDTNITAAGRASFYTNTTAWIIDDFGGPAPASTPIAGTDTGAGSAETAATTQTTPVTGSDSGSGTEVITDLDKLSADVGSGLDGCYFTWGYPLSSDVGSGADTGVAAVAALSVTGADTGAGSDSGVVSVAPVFISSSDTGSGSEASSRSATIASSDLGSGVETAVLSVPVADAGSGAETSARSATIASSDAGAGSDSIFVDFPMPALVPTSEIGTSDSVLGNISLGLPGPLGVPLIAGADTGAGSESLLTTAAIPTSEAGASSDSLALAVVTPGALDSGAGSDASSPITALAGTDVAVGSENALTRYLAASADTGTGIESGQLVTQVVANDVGTASESAQIIASQIGASDAANGADALGARGAREDDTGTASAEAAFATVGGVAVDLGSGAESSAIAPSLVQPEAGVGADTLALRAVLTGADTATGAETSALTQAIVGADAGASADAAVLGTYLAVGSDQGAAAEASSMLYGLSGAETGTGADAIANRALAVPETSVGADNAFLPGLTAGNDPGKGTDNAVVVVAPVSRSDSDAGGASAETSLLAAFLNSQPTIPLTFVGDLINDANRTANVQGDGIGGIVTNLIPNGGVETNANGWIQIGTSPSFWSRSTVRAKFGTASIKVTRDANAGYEGATPNATVLAVTGGATYTFSVWVYADSASGIAANNIGLYFDEIGQGQLTYITNITLPALDTWVRLSHTRTLQPGTTQLRVGAFHIGQGGAADSGDTFYMDGLQLEVGATASPYVDTSGVSVTKFIAGDSSFGFWEQSQNLVPNGGFETNTNGWSVWYGTVSALVRDTSKAKFGSASLAVTSSGQDGAATGPKAWVGVQSTVVPVAGTQYTASVWVNVSTSGNYLLRITDAPSLWQALGPVVALTAGVWTRLSVAFTPTNTSAPVFRIEKSGGPTWAAGEQVWLDGLQIEQRPFATPYIHTDGAAATHTRAYATCPSSLLNDQQGWIAFRFRSGVDSAGRFAGNTYQHLFSWYAPGDNTTYYDLYYNGQANPGYFTVRRNIAGVNTALTQKTQALTVGQILTVIMQWDGTTVSLSIDGGSFLKSSAGSGTISLAGNPVFNIGGIPLANNQSIDGDILWMACGKGTLLDADAATIHANANLDPAPDPTFRGETMVWAANDGFGQGLGEVSSGIEQLPALAAQTAGSDVSNVSTQLAALVAQCADSDVGALALDLAATLSRYADNDANGATSETAGKDARIASADTGSDIETATIVGILAAALDAGAGAETGILAVSFQRNDDAAGSESGVRVGYANVSDSGSGADVILAMARALSDSGAGSESFRFGVGVLDQGSGLEAALGRALILVPDSAIGTETGVTLLSIIPAGDIGTSIQNAVLALIGNQTGSGIDSSSLRATLTNLDSALARDLSALLARLSDLDSGSTLDIAVRGRGIILPSIRTGSVEGAEPGKAETGRSGVLTRPKVGVGKPSGGRAGYVAKPKAGVAK